MTTRFSETVQVMKNLLWEFQRQGLTFRPA